jgi:DNA-binding MarR family transcriptional regulator
MVLLIDTPDTPNGSIPGTLALERVFTITFRYVYEQRSSVSDILNRMEKQGPISKTAKTDGKGRVLVKITAKGLPLLESSEQRNHLPSVKSVLNEEKRRQLESILELLRDEAAEELSTLQKTILPPSRLSRFYTKKDMQDF